MAASTVDKLLVAPKASLAIAKAIGAAAGGLLLGTNGAPIGDHIINTAIRAAFSSFAVNQLQWLIPSFTDAYRSFCSKNKLVPDISKIASAPGDANGFWIGNKSTAKYHMVYYHGGGFVMPGNSAHLEMLSKFVAWSGDSLAVFCVAYTLSPEAPYPLALSQCIEGLRFVLDQPGRSPANVVLGGDSAGGNLVLGVISHILHPHPRKDLVKPLSLQQPLFAAIVVSPWISSDAAQYRSFDRFSQRDNFPLVAAQYWSACYKGQDSSLPDDEYIWAASADASWWTQSPCRKMLATVGSNEVLLDSIVDWSQKYAQGAGKEKVDLVIGDNETHVYPLVAPKADAQLLDTKSQTQERAIMRWIQQTLT